MKINPILMAGLTTFMMTACNEYKEGIPSEPLEECVYAEKVTSFSLWSPAAESVQVKIYDDALSETAVKRVNMVAGKQGLWSAEIEEDLKGKFYTFQVEIGGKLLEETEGIAAKAVGVNGMRGAIIDWNETNPSGWEKDRSPKIPRSEAIIYELHHRDFSIHESAGNAYPGKYLALTQEGTHNPEGLSTGIDHLKELGVTYVQLLPSTDFATLDETKEGNYNWGYEPLNYNAVEGTYSTDPYQPTTRIREFKSMIQSLHQAGFRVILDVVYNHTTQTSNTGFERTMPGYFYRMLEDGSFCNGSGCGNETASERPMFRKFMIESLEWWMKEYHIDGFRFDLMAIHDLETMNLISKHLHAIDPDVLLYGEGWAASSPAYPTDSLAFKSNTHRMEGIGAFSDNLRDALRGPLDCSNAGFMDGRKGNRDQIQFGIAGGVSHPQVMVEPWCNSPLQHISYVSCHDDHCLRDRLNEAVKTTDLQKIRMVKLAQTAVYTSQGIPFIFNGEEIFRHKKGVKNSYNQPDAINAIDWNYKTQYKDLFDYYCGLAQLRKSHPAFCLGTAEAVREHLEFLENESDLVVGYRLKDLQGIDSSKSLIVLLNSMKKNTKVEIPQGRYRILAEDGQFLEDSQASFEGNHIMVKAISATILEEI